MTKIITVLLLSCTANLLSAQQIGMLKKAGDMNSNNQAFSTVIDHAHNTIISGMLYDTSSFNTTILASHGGYDGYVAKYDTSGNVLWAKTFGGAGNDYIGHSAVDASNNVYITGTFKSTSIYFTPTDSLVKMSPAAISNSYLAKFDPNGTFLWARLVGSNTQAETWSVAIDPWGNAIIGGVFNMDITISGTPFTNAFYNLYMAKFTSAGVLDWAKLGSSEGLCKINELSCDYKGNIYAIGKLSTNLTFGTVTATNIGGDDAWFGKYDSSGKCLFMKVLGGSYFVTTTDGALDGGNTIQPDKLGNFFVGGNLLITWGTPVSQMGYYAKYNDTGAQVWMHTFGINFESVTGIALDNNNDPYISGLVYAADTVGGTVVPYTAGGNTFIGSFDKTTGNANWIKTSTTNVGGNSGTDVLGYLSTGSIAVDQASGTIMASGQFQSQMSFDAFSVSSTDATATYNDIYMLRIWNSSRLVQTPVIVADDELSIYPNPVKNDVNIIFNSGVWHKISLQNLNGQVVNEWETNAPDFTTNLQSVSPGNYLLLITDNNNNKAVRKVSKL